MREGPADSFAEIPDYVETGGATWREGAWTKYVSWPFARIQISRECIRLTVRFWRLVDVAFDLEKIDLIAIRIKRGLFSVGLLLEHRNPQLSPLIVFWTFRRKALLQELGRLGYGVEDQHR